MILIPAYQEAAIIADTVRPLLAAGYTVVVIDDGSTDGTREQLTGWDVHYLRHPINLGQGAALQTGMQYAQQQKAPWVVHFDADGQHQVEDIGALLQPIKDQQADVVLGSRFLPGAGYEGMSRGRRRLLRVAIRLNNWLTGIRLSDAHNGLRALSYHAYSQIDLQQNGMAHATELIQEIHRLKLRYIEVPVSIRYTDYSRQKGQSGWQALPILADWLTQRWL